MTDDKTLICLVGLPRSGKSTLARKMGVPIVNPDSIRYALHGERFLARAEPWVWASAHMFVHALFLAGHRFVLVDATNTTRKRRDDWRSEHWAVEFLHVETPADVCCARAEEARDSYILPIIERMALRFEPLQPDEARFEIAMGAATV